MTATKRKSDRIRVYRTHEAPECLGKKDLSVNYLFIDDLQPSDGGIYNCYAELYYIWGDVHDREYYPIEVIPGIDLTVISNPSTVTSLVLI